MPVVELSYKRLQKLLGDKISKKSIIETLPFLGLDIESESSEIIRVEYSPNRPDYSTDYGIAIGLEGLLDRKIGNQNLKIKKSDYSLKVNSSVSKIRPYITGLCAKNGLVDETTIKQFMVMQEDLHFGIGRKRKKSSIGLHDLDKVSFPLTYTTTNRSHELIPLNETKSMTIDKILSSTDTGKDYSHLLGNSKSVPIILDSEGKSISFPPVINASLTTVTTKTKNLFVEVTGLNKHDVEDALSVIATILQKAGFELYEVKISGAKNSTPSFTERKIVLNPKLVNDTLGLNLSSSSIVSCLKKSRISASQKNKKILCIIPRYRFDIFGEMDIVEEVALGYGIAKMEPKLSPSQTIGNFSDKMKKIRDIDEILIGLGYTEALNSNLTSKRILYESTNRTPKETLSVLDSKSQEHTILRDSILPGLIENLAKNIHQPYPQKLYETGTVFATGNPIKEEFNLAAILAYKKANFSELKSIIQSTLKIGFNIELQTKTLSRPLFNEGRSAAILVNNKPIGHIGEINSKTLDYFKIRVPVVGFELKLTGLIFD